MSTYLIPVVLVICLFAIGVLVREGVSLELRSWMPREHRSEFDDTAPDIDPIHQAQRDTLARLDTMAQAQRARDIEWAEREAASLRGLAHISESARVIPFDSRRAS